MHLQWTWVSPLLNNVSTCEAKGWGIDPNHVSTRMRILVHSNPPDQDLICGSTYMKAMDSTFVCGLLLIAIAIFALVRAFDSRAGCDRVGLVASPWMRRPAELVSALRSQTLPNSCDNRCKRSRPGSRAECGRQDPRQDTTHPSCLNPMWSEWLLLLTYQEQLVFDPADDRLRDLCLVVTRFPNTPRVRTRKLLLPVTSHLQPGGAQGRSSKPAKRCRQSIEG